MKYRKGCVPIRFLQKVLASVLLLTLMLAPCLPGAQAKETVRVGFYSYPGFQNIDSQGKCSGYVYDYLYELRKYTQWDYEFVPLSFSECVDALAEGKIDLMCGVWKTEERARQFLFPESACGVESLGLYVLDGSRFEYEDIAGLQGVRIGILNGTEELQTFNAFCARNSLSVTTVFYQGEDELLAALRGGEIDALVSSNMHVMDGVRLVTNFASRSFYFMTNQSRPDLIKALNYGMGQLHYYNPNFERTLQSKYFSPSVNAKPVFTAAEEAYLASKPVIRVAYSKGWRPIEYENENGDFDGIIASIMDKIEELTGLSFEYYGYDSYAEQLDAFDRGEVDMLSYISSDYSWASEQNATLSLSYLTLPTISIRNLHTKDSAAPTLAMPRGTHLMQKMTALYPESHVVLYPNTVACIEAVARGEADVTFSNSYTAREYLSNPRYKMLDMVALLNDTRVLSFGYPADADPNLISTIDKSLSSLSKNTLTQLITEEALLEQGEMSLLDFIYYYPIQSIAVVAAILALIILLLAGAMIVKSRHDREICALTYTDPLTDTPNFNQFRRDASALLSGTHAHPYALLYINITHFKSTNEALGYTAGDEILKATAHTLLKSSRSGEVCARVHSDHFAALAIFDGEDALLERILRCEQDIRGALQGIPNFDLSYSIGIYRLSAEDHDLNTALDRAKHAEDYTSGTPQCTIAYYDEEMRLRLQSEQELEHELSRAIQAGEFFPLYQPKVDCTTGKAVGFEALCRWQHPTRGVLGPLEFIPIAEKTGCVTKIDLYIFETVCRELRARIDNGRRPYPVSCNFSRLHLFNEHFAADIAAIADRYEVDHALLEIEITETVAIENLDLILPQFNQIKGYGFSIAIDDFGSGYSSLNLLTTLPCDTIKLDKSFLKHHPITEDDKMLLDSIVTLAHRMGKHVICEGVETEEQIALMHELGCRIVQGYYYARPLNLAEAEEYLLRERAK